MPKFLLLSCFVIILILCAFTLPCYGESLKIGIVDMQRVIQESEKGKQAFKDFEIEFKEKKENLEPMYDELETLKKEIFENISIWSDEIKDRKQEEFNQKLKKYQREKEELDDQMENKNLDLNKKIITEVMEVLEEVAKKENYTIILEKGSILFAAPLLDITQKIIEKYNERFKTSH